MPTSLLRAGPLAADFVSGINRPTFGVRNGHRIAKFPNNVITETFFTLNMPTVFANGDVKVQLHWMAESAIVGDVTWGVAFERHLPETDDLDFDSFGPETIFVDTAPDAAGKTAEAIITVIAANMDGVSQGDQFRLRIRRLGDDSSDTMAGTAQLMTVVLEQDADPVGGGGGGFFTEGTGTRAGIGKGSPAPTAAGTESLAHGSGASADFDEGIAFGTNAITLEARGIALGNNSRAGDYTYTSPDAIGIGTYAQSHASRGVAIGYRAYQDDNSYSGVAIGDTSYIYRPHCVAIGVRNNANGNHSILIGYENDQNHSNGGILIGKQNVSNGGYTMLLGWRNQAYNGGNSNTILIGNDNYLNNQGYRAIILGHENEFSQGVGVSTVMLTRSSGIFGGSTGNQRGVVIGGEDWMTGSNAQGYHYASIILRSGSDQKNGTYLRDANINGCFVAGINRGCLRDGFTNYFGHYYSHAILSNTYIYGYSSRCFFFLSDSQVGDSGGQVYIYKSVFIGYDINDCDIYATNEGVQNIVVIGSGCYAGRYDNTKGQIAIGYEAWIGETNYVYTAGNIAIGNYAWVYGPGYGNVALGQYSVIESFAKNNYYNGGNFAVGRWCYVQNASGYLQSAMAQGVNGRAWISGQRAWGSGGQEDIDGNTSPNQHSFIVEKEETTDATQTTIISFPTLADKAYGIWGFAVARRTDADGSNAVFSMAHTLMYRNAAGGPVLNGDPVSWTMDDNQGSPGWTMDATISGNNLLIRIQGTAAQTVEWEVTLFINEVRG